MALQRGGFYIRTQSPTQRWYSHTELRNIDFLSVNIYFFLLLRRWWHAHINIHKSLAFDRSGQGVKHIRRDDVLPATMSVQEPPTSTSPFKPEAKPRPEIPPKPQCSSPTLGERDSNVRRSGGKVKRIVNQFSKQESTERLEPATHGTAEVKPVRQTKRPPTIKPKPRVRLQLQKEAEQAAPPLPKKRSRLAKKQKELGGGEEGDRSSVEGGRSGKALGEVYGRNTSILSLIYYFNLCWLEFNCRFCHRYKDGQSEVRLVFKKKQKCILNAVSHQKQVSPDLLETKHV